MHQFLLSFCLLVCTPLYAAAPRVLAWDDSTAARKLAIVSDSTQVEIIGMHPLKRTSPFQIKGSPPFFVRALDKPSGADGKPVQLAFTIPDSFTHPLLLIIPDESQPTGVRTLILDDNPAGFHWGGYRFLNATPKELAIRLEDKAVRVPTGWKPVDLDLGGETRGVAVAAVLTDDLGKQLYSAVWEYDKNVRTLVFMIVGTDPRFSPVLFKAIPQDKLALEPDSPIP